MLLIDVEMQMKAIKSCQHVPIRIVKMEKRLLILSVCENVKQWGVTIWNIK